MPPDLKVRCFCIKKTLLAVVGSDTESGQPFLHVKVYKQGRIMANLVVVSGLVRLQCRDCGRWHKIRVTKPTPEIITEELPKTLAIA